MDEDLIKSCRSAESQLEPKPYEGKCTMTEFYQLWKELNNWLYHMRTKVQRDIAMKPERYDIDLDASHDLSKNIDRRQQLIYYADELCNSLPRYKDEVSAKMLELEDNWLLIEESISNSVHALQQRETLLVDLAFELNELQMWLASILSNDLLPPECSDASEFASLSDDQRSECLHFVQKREDEIQFKLKAVGSVRKVLGRLRIGSESDDDERRLQNLFDLTERLKCHFYELWLQLLEFKYSLDLDFSSKQRNAEQSSDSKRNLSTIVPSSWGAESGFVSQLSPVHKIYGSWHDYDMTADNTNAIANTAASRAESAATGSNSSCDVLPFSDEEYEKLPTVIHKRNTPCASNITLNVYSHNDALDNKRCGQFFVLSQKYKINSNWKRSATNSAPILRSNEIDASVKITQRNHSWNYINVNSNHSKSRKHDNDYEYSSTNNNDKQKIGNFLSDAALDSADSEQHLSIYRPSHLLRQRNCRSVSQYEDSLKFAKQADRYFTKSAIQLDSLHHYVSNETELSGNYAEKVAQECALAADDINQKWDDYQVPLYSNLSDHSKDNVERLDDSHLLWETDEGDVWQRLDRRNEKMNMEQNWCIKSNELADVESDYTHALHILQSQLVTGMHDATANEVFRLKKLLVKATTCVRDLQILLTNSTEMKASQTLSSILNEWKCIVNQLQSLIQCCEFLIQAHHFVSDTKCAAVKMQHQLGFMQFKSAQQIADHVAELRVMEDKLHDWLRSITDLHCRLQSPNYNVLHILRNANDYLQNLLLLSQWLASLRERCGTKICILLKIQEKLLQLIRCLTECEQNAQQQSQSVESVRAHPAISFNEKKSAISKIQSILSNNAESEAVLNCAYRLLSDSRVYLSMIPINKVEQRIETVAKWLETIKADCAARLSDLADLSQCVNDDIDDRPTVIVDYASIIINRHTNGLVKLGSVAVLIMCSIFLALLVHECSGKVLWTVLLKDTQPRGAPF